MTRRPDSDPIGSTHEYARSASQMILDQYDLVSLSPVNSILGKAEGLNPLVIFSSDPECQTNLDQNFPTFVPSFKKTFMEALHQLADGKTGLTALDLVRTYEHTVEVVLGRISWQVRREMFMPKQFGDILEYFGVPILPSIVEEIRRINPVVAGGYEERAHRWVAGI